MTTQININQTLSIPTREIYFTFSCSKGPGGQHVNKVNTRVTLWFDITKSSSLSEKQQEIIREKLTSRVNKNGVLRVVSYRHRSQNANKIAAIEKFTDLIRLALVKKKHRTKTNVPKNQKRKRLSDKKIRSRLKDKRGRTSEDD